MNEEQTAFAGRLAARWGLLVAWASGCLATDYEGAAGAVRGAMCDAQGVANLRQKLKGCGAGPWIDHWFKEANPARLNGSLEATALDVLGSELEQTEKCAVKEGYKLPDGAGRAGERLIPPPRDDGNLTFLASWAAALDRAAGPPAPPPAAPRRAATVGAVVVLGVVGAVAFLAGKGRL